MTKISAGIKELDIVPGTRIFVAPRKTKDVVTIEGSVIGGKSHVSAYQEMVPVMAAMLLDAGTKTKTKDVLRESLAARGATLAFYAKGERIHFRGSCLPEDLALLIRTLSECLGESVFPKEEVEIARELLLGELTEEKSDTRAQAAAALTRAVFDKTHPNYSTQTQVRMRSVEGIERKDLTAFAKNLGKEGLLLAIVGDVTLPAATKALQSLKKLPKGVGVIPEVPVNAKAPVASESLVTIANKANIDVYIGTSLGISVHDPRFIPLMYLSDMLGARGFSGHLMQTIRERDGLTYGIYAMHTGFEDGRDGMFRIWATFSPDTFRKAVSRTFEELEIFFTTKLTEEAIEERKDRLVGAFLMSLATTDGLAAVLHKLGLDGRPLSFLDTYPALIRAMTRAQIQEAAALVRRDALSLAAAGTFADKA